MYKNALPFYAMYNRKMKLLQYLKIACSVNETGSILLLSLA